MTPLSPPLLTEELPLRAEQDELEAALQSRLSNAVEIRLLLTRLVAERAIVSLYPERRNLLVSLPVLALDAHLLILGLPEETDRAAVFDSRQLVCVALLDRVKLQFEVSYPKLIEWQHMPALALTGPASILRLQRRDSYRLTIPLNQPLSCFIPLPHDEEVEVSIIDLSLGGMGILAFIPGLSLRPGTVYHGMRIELPGMASVAVDARVRSRFELVLRNGIRTIRTGFEFGPMSLACQHQIQHYISKAEQLLHHRAATYRPD